MRKKDYTRDRNRDRLTTSLALYNTQAENILRIIDSLEENDDKKDELTERALKLLNKLSNRSNIERKETRNFWKNFMLIQVALTVMVFISNEKYFETIMPVVILLIPLNSIFLTYYTAILKMIEKGRVPGWWMKELDSLNQEVNSWLNDIEQISDATPAG